MAKSDTTRDIHLAGAAAGRAAARETCMQRISDGLGRCAARFSTCALSIAVALMVMAQNADGQERSTHLFFELAPNLPEFEAEVGAEVPYKFLAAPVMTSILVVAAVFLLRWVTVGGGRKQKTTQD